MLTTQLSLLRRKAQIEAAFRTRCPHYSHAEFGALFEWQVEVQVHARPRARLLGHSRHVTVM